MAVDETIVRRVAKLARIAVKDDEVAHLAGELSAILSFVEELSAVDVSDVEPMTSVLPMKMPMREDRVTQVTASSTASAVTSRAASSTATPLAWLPSPVRSWTASVATWRPG